MSEDEERLRIAREIVDTYIKIEQEKLKQAAQPSTMDWLGWLALSLLAFILGLIAQAWVYGEGWNMFLAHITGMRVYMHDVLGPLMMLRMAMMAQHLIPNQKLALLLKALGVEEKLSWSKVSKAALGSVCSPFLVYGMLWIAKILSDALAGAGM
jgi:hypothetical protein